MSTFLSFFNRQAPRPNLSPAAGPTIPTQIFVTLDTTTRVDPPDEKRSLKLKFKRGSRGSGKQQTVFPDTPRAPQANRTTFLLTPGPGRDSPRVSQWYKDNDSDCGSSDCGDDVSPIGTTVYVSDAEPKTLARTLFFFGFLLPLFWVAGLAIILMPLHTTPDWELGKTPSGIAWEKSILRATELRWAKRCLIALIIEMVIIVLIIVTAKWGAHMI